MISMSILYMKEKPRIIGLDVGDKTIGVAVSDPMGWTAQGLGVIQRQSIQKDLKALSLWVHEYKPYKIIVGRLLKRNGSLSQQAEKNKNFPHAMQKKFRFFQPVGSKNHSYLME